MDMNKLPLICTLKVYINWQVDLHFNFYQLSLSVTGQVISFCVILIDEARVLFKVQIHKVKPSLTITDWSRVH